MHFAQHADPQQVKAAAAVGALVLLYLAVRTAWTAVFVIMACFASLAFAAYLAKWVLSKDEGTADMQEVSDAIREGADGFFATQYNLIGKLAGVLAVVARGSRHPRDVLPPRGFIRVHRGGASRAVNAAPRYGDATNRRRARRH